MKSTTAVAFLFFVTVAYGQTTHLSGSRVHLEPTNEALRNALSAVEHTIDHGINSIYVHRVGKVIEAYSQLVSGIKYYVTFELNETSCKKAETTDYSACNSVNKIEKCYAEVWSKPWEHQVELITFRC